MMDPYFPSRAKQNPDKAFEELQRKERRIETPRQGALELELEIEDIDLGDTPTNVNNSLEHERDMIAEYEADEVIKGYVNRGRIQDLRKAFGVAQWASGIASRSAQRLVAQNASPIVQKALELVTSEALGIAAEVVKWQYETTSEKAARPGFLKQADMVADAMTELDTEQDLARALDLLQWRDSKTRKNDPMKDAVTKKIETIRRNLELKRFDNGDPGALPGAQDPAPGDKPRMQ